MLDGGETVTVLVLVLIDVLMLGSVVVVVVSVDGGVVSVTVWVGATSGADVVGVVDVVVVLPVLSEESDSRLTDNHTMSATRSAMSAPKPMRAAGVRYQGVGGSDGGSPGCWL